MEINKLVQTKYIFVYAVCIHSFTKLFVHNRNVYIVLVVVIQIIRKGTEITSGTAHTFAIKKDYLLKARMYLKLGESSRDISIANICFTLIIARRPTPITSSFLSHSIYEQTLKLF